MCKCFGNISQLETRHLIGWLARSLVNLALVCEKNTHSTLKNVTLISFRRISWYLKKSLCVWTVNHSTKNGHWPVWILNFWPWNIVQWWIDDHFDLDYRLISLPLVKVGYKNLKIVQKDNSVDLNRFPSNVVVPFFTIFQNFATT